MTSQTSYDDIKQYLINMYNISQQVSNPPNHIIENFTVQFNNLPDNVDAIFDKESPPLLKQYNLKPTELIKVIEKFDLEPSELTQTEKDLRVKYLQTLLKAINDNYNLVVMLAQKHPVILQMQQGSKLIFDNMNPAKNLIVRIIKLLIAEITIVCPVCPIIPKTICPDCAIIPKTICPDCAICPKTICPDCPIIPKTIFPDCPIIPKTICPDCAICPKTICPDCAICPIIPKTICPPSNSQYFIGTIGFLVLVIIIMSFFIIR